jgi:hypothetical protein
MVNKRKSRGQREDRRSLGRQREEALFPAAPPRAGLPRDSGAVLDEIKRRIQQERLRVVMAANSAMVLLYWDIGQLILQRQDRAGWGSRVIDRLAKDLRDAFPDTRGFSPRNLKYMRALAAAWPERTIVQEPLAQITWRHNIALTESLPLRGRRPSTSSRRQALHWSVTLPLQKPDRGGVCATGPEKTDWRRAVGDEHRQGAAERVRGDLTHRGRDRSGTHCTTQGQTAAPTKKVIKRTRRDQFARDVVESPFPARA